MEAKKRLWFSAAETAKLIQKTTVMFSKYSKEVNVPKSINNIQNKAFVLHNIFLKCWAIENLLGSANAGFA